MYFYKALQNNQFLGIATSYDLGKEFQKRNGSTIMVSATEEEAQYVLINGLWYHDMWLRPENEMGKYPLVKLIQITEDEYNALYSAIEKNEEIPEISEEVIPDIVEEEISEDDITTKEFVLNSKLKEMSYQCSSVIVLGFDVELSDEKSHHFSLTEQDQLNLITLSTMVAAGETAIPYHADGEPCKFYSVEDITTILNAATAYKAYHVTYHNSLKTYINSLEDIKEISACEYGMEIPVEYQSDVMRVLLMQQ